MRQLIAEKDNLNTKHLELEIKYDNDIQKKDERIKQLEKQISDLQNACTSSTNGSSGGHAGRAGTQGGADPGVDVEKEKKMKDYQVCCSTVS